MSLVTMVPRHVSSAEFTKYLCQLLISCRCTGRPLVGSPCGYRANSGWTCWAPLLRRGQSVGPETKWDGTSTELAANPRRKSAYHCVHVDLPGGNDEHTAESDRLSRWIEVRREWVPHGTREVAVPLLPGVRQRYASPRRYVDQRWRFQVAIIWAHNY